MVVCRKLFLQIGFIINYSVNLNIGQWQGSKFEPIFGSN